MACGVRDFQCSQEVEIMDKLGFIDEEFTAYGCAWREQGTVFYFLSGSQEEVKIFSEKNERAIWTTPVEQFMQRLSVPSGLYEELNQKTKVLLAKKMQLMYTSRLFDCIERVCSLERQGSAYEILCTLQEQLEGLFDRDKLNYFAAIVESTYIAGKLTAEQYTALQKWLTANFKQMEDDIVVEERYQRRIGGFYYRKPDDSLNLYVNAKEQFVYQQANVYMQKGYQVLPIFWKTYWSNTMENGKVAREQFQKDLQIVLADGILERVLEIKALPSVVPEQVYCQVAQNLQKEGTHFEQEAWKQLGAYWDCEYKITIK